VILQNSTIILSQRSSFPAFGPQPGSNSSYGPISPFRPRQFLFALPVERLSGQANEKSSLCRSARCIRRTGVCCAVSAQPRKTARSNCSARESPSRRGKNSAPIVAATKRAQQKANQRIKIPRRQANAIAPPRSPITIGHRKFRANSHRKFPPRQQRPNSVQNSNSNPAGYSPC